MGEFTHAMRNPIKERDDRIAMLEAKLAEYARKEAMTTEKIREWVNDYSDANVQDDESNGLLLMDGYDDCIVGIAEQFNRVFVVYDRTKVINKLVEQGMTLEEAEEFHEFNQARAWHGDHTPAFITLPSDAN